MLTREQAVKLGVPPAMRDRYVIRCTDQKSGDSSKGNPMITLSWEIVGYSTNLNEPPLTKIEKGGSNYVIGGLKVKSSYFTLVEGQALSKYIEFYELVHGVNSFQGVDPANPDIAYTKNLVMEAMLQGREESQRKELTPDEKQAMIDAGKPPIGDIIKDSSGNEIKRPEINVTLFVSKYTGVLNPF